MCSTTPPGGLRLLASRESSQAAGTAGQRADPRRDGSCGHSDKWLRERRWHGLERWTRKPQPVENFRSPEPCGFLMQLLHPCQGAGEPGGLAFLKGGRGKEKGGGASSERLRDSV